MRLEGYYSSGQFAAMANVTVRTIRFYDKQNILKPSYVNENGARFYTDSDLARLQQILLLKYLGFSLDEIRTIAVDPDHQFMLNSLRLQQKLIQDRIEQLELVSKAISDTTQSIEKDHHLDWSRMLRLIHLTGMENSMATQYRSASNLSARIRLHTMYAVNKQGWFPWVYEQCRIEDGMRILELGCGDGSLWTQNKDKLPDGIHVELTDISEGMIRDARRNIGSTKADFSSYQLDCEKLAQLADDEKTYERIIANHVLFYAKDPGEVCERTAHLLARDGMFVCSTYGSAHMKEIRELVEEFDSRIVLSDGRLYDRFGMENGRYILEKSFAQVQEKRYPDSLEVTEAEPLIEYILSCHGNQNQYIMDRYSEFRQFVQEKTEHGFSITKDAGLFLCRQPVRNRG